MKLISILIPAYNEEANLGALADILFKVTAPLVHKYSFEFIVLDNASDDNTRQIALDQAAKDDRWKYIRYSRNFGAEASILAGLDYCTGDAAILLFSDLQDPPEKIPEMLQLWEDGADVVYGVVRDRGDKSLFKSWGARVAYRLINRLTESKIPVDGTDYRLLDRSVVSILRQMREADRYFRGLVHWVGFKQVPFYYDRRPRMSGISTAGLKFCIKYAFNAIFCFSAIPMRISLIFGILLTVCSLFLSVLYAILHFAQPVFLEPPPPGLTTLILLGLFVVGTNSLFLGLIGEYIGRIYNQGKSRPLYIVRETHNVDLRNE